MKTKFVRYEVDTDCPPPLTEAQREQLMRLDAMPDEEIDFSDIPRQDFANAIPLREHLKLRREERELEASVRLDPEVLGWLKSVGADVGQRVNAILREAMLRETR